MENSKIMQGNTGGGGGGGADMGVDLLQASIQSTAKQTWPEIFNH